MRKKWGAWIISCLYAFTVQASIIEVQAEKNITQLYHSLAKKKNASFGERIDWVSEQFLNKPYFLGSLGEGSTARFDQFPLYRTDAFDCETYVDTVLSMALANNLEDFKTWMLRIRYAKGKKSYIYRNHFTELDWNKNAHNLGLLEDVTQQIGKSQTAWANTVINKSGWYLHKPETAIRLRTPTPEQIQKRHKELVNKHALFKQYPVTTAYLPLTVLFDAQKKPRMKFFRQIPRDAVIEIVRPDWKLKNIIGTNLNISHMGFAIWKKDVLYYRNASQNLGKVIDMPLVEYLTGFLDSPTIKGINIQKILTTQS